MKAHILLSAVFTFPSIAWALDNVFLWPVPQNITSGQTKMNLDPSFEIKGSYSSPILDRAVDRYSRIISKERWVPIQVPVRAPAKAGSGGQQQKMQERDTQIRISVGEKALESLEIRVEDSTAELVQGVDESYVLDIPNDDNTATLIAATVWGALRGLETFSQLVQGQRHGIIRDYDNSEREEERAVVNNGFKGLFIPEAPIHIEDSPRFTHRGLMLDTSRNYFPVKDILRTLDAMAYNKMNVFHWHITDSQSFPLRLDSAPELAEHGAYVFNGRRLVYTKKDVKRIVQYAKERGIRVIPEIDMPAHTGSWGLAYQDITTCTGRFFLDETNKWDERYAAEPTTGQLNPVLDKTYEVVGKVIAEIASMFPDGSYHGGGDEPIYKCWEDEASVREYMSTHNATGDDLLNKFLTKEVDFIKKAGKQPILWEDSVTNNNLAIPKDVVLQVWVNPAQLAAKKGYKIIASHASFWYLDCGHGGWTGNNTSYDEQVPPKIPESLQRELERYGLEDNYRPSNWGGAGGDWCSPFKSWQRIYSYDMTFNLTETEASNVLGGEVAMWSEQMDPVGMDGRLWPRAAAAAEVMWSGRHDKNGVKRDVGEAMPRMFDWRYRLVTRGIHAEAIQPLWCGQNPYMCDSNYPAALLPQNDDHPTTTGHSKTEDVNVTGAIHVGPLETKSFTVSHDIYT